ncbi:MAG: hypothetical protein WBA61_03835 [Aequorivita sp.]
MEPKVKITSERIRFMDKYGELNDSDTLQEILYVHYLQLTKLEKIRSNTSMLVWWLVALPIIIGIIIVFLGMFSRF